jgi:two-component system OmpR family sensor kinase
VSLRRRLIVGLLLLVAVIVSILFVATSVVLRTFMVERLDAQLREFPIVAVRVFCEAPTTVPTPPTSFHFARLSPTGTPLGRCAPTNSAQTLDLTPADGARLIRAAGAPIEIAGPRITVRAYAAELPGRPGEFGVLALSTAEIDATLNRLVIAEAVLAALALAGTAGVGVLGIRWSLRPLRQITGTARAVADDVSSGAGGLHRRVYQGPSHTEVGQLASAFNRMLTAVQTEVAVRQDSEQRIRQFLADASHELRTPLTTLRGYAELLSMRARRPGGDSRDDWFDALWRIESEGTRMARLVDDLLTLARADQDQPVARVPVHIDRLARDAVADVRAVFPDRAVSLQVDEGSIVDGDPDQLRQVIANLLTNAAAHTSGPIRVTVAGGPRNVVLAVDDDGPGLTASEAAHVFDRFWRADTARTRARGGSGLGLPIVDTLVAAHDGTIRFDSSPLAGTTVLVELPRWRPGHPLRSVLGDRSGALAPNPLPTAG